MAKHKQAQEEVQELPESPPTEEAAPPPTDIQQTCWMRVGTGRANPTGHSTLRIRMEDETQESFPIVVGQWHEVNVAIKRAITNPDKHRHLLVNEPLQRRIEFSDKKPKVQED